MEMLPHDVALLRSDDHEEEDSLLRFQSSLLSLNEMDVLRGLEMGLSIYCHPLQKPQARTQWRSFICSHLHAWKQDLSSLLRGASRPQISRRASIF